MRTILTRFSLLLSSLALCAAAAPPPTRDWAQVATDDLHFIRAMLRENHPGPIDTENPAFLRWYRDGFDEAMGLAARARSYAGYYFAIQRYVVGFQDNHIGALADDRLDPAVRLVRRWPGFVLGLDQGRYRVAQSTVANVPAGAELVGCDGRSADTLADEILKPYFRLWSIRGTRPRTAPFLLIDEGNPFIRRPDTCTFSVAGQRRTTQLAWTDIDPGTLAERIHRAEGRVEQPTGIRRFGSNGWWIALPSFDANDDRVSKGLAEVIARMNEMPAAFRDADALVFDVRGNTGGNSEFGVRIATALWGEGVRARIPYAKAVDWRVSDVNIRQMERGNLSALERRFGANDPKILAYAELIKAMKAAQQRGDAFYRPAQDDRPASDAAAPIARVRAKVVLLTDGWCGSACLDFADIVLSAPGVIHAGSETSADTVYIDNTGARLPSGEGAVGWSMKVYRGRPRGHNQSYVPTAIWGGSMADTAGLEKWIAGLAR